MKVLLFAAGLHSPGGTAKHLRQLGEALQARGVDTRIVVGSREADRLRAFFDERPGAKVSVVPFEGPRAVTALRLAGALMRDPPDVVIAVFALSEVMAAFLRPAMGRARVVALIEVEHFSRSYRPLQRRLVEGLWQRACPRIDRFVAVAPHLLEGIPFDRGEVIPLGLHASELQALAHAATTRAASQRLRVGYWGRLHPDKGVELLVEAMENLDLDRFELRIAGDGPSREALAARLAAQGRGGALQAWTPDLPQLLRNLDVLVLPSAHEGMPWSVLEAMAARVVVVGTDLPALRALLGEGRGHLLPERTAAAVARALEQLASDKASREAMAEAAQQWVRREATLEVEVSRWLSLLRPRAR